MEPQPTVSVRVVYHGRVQGVGFRATAAAIARGFPVSGYVRNQSDGTVELVAVGEASAVDGFLAAVAEEFRDNISRTQTDAIAPPEGLTGFHIRR